jgi:hypothetical protein
MTAPTQLSNQPAVPIWTVTPKVARSVPPAPPTRPLPAPPAPVLPIAPGVRGWHMAGPARGLVLAPVVDGAEAAGSPRLRSGRVARLIAVVTVTLAVVASLGWLGQGPNPGIPAETTVIRVGAGETLWDVARRVAPQADQRAVVERTRQLNGIAGSSVAPGQQLQVPDGR